jgi:hypothetical protein
MDHTRQTPNRRTEATRKESRQERDHPPHTTGLRSADSMHLNSLPKRKPGRKSAQIRWLWPEIRTALAAGHTIGDVQRELALDGVEISYSKLRTCVARLRKTDPMGPSPDHVPQPRATTLDRATVHTPTIVEATSPSPARVEPSLYDPLANLRERLTRRPGFQYDGRPPDEKKLI